MFHEILKTSIIFLTLLLTASCALFGGGEPSEDEINTQAEKAYTEIKLKSKYSKNAEWNDLVQKVSKRIALASNENFKWEAILIESPEVNAWCMPGGKIAVYTGIIPVLKTEGALAAVLGHEVAHATLRHGKERYARAIKESYAGLIIGGATAIGGQLLCKTESCRKLTGLGGVAASLALTFFERKYSRVDETSADQIGQLYMARAGYDPSESIRLWERMGKAVGSKAPPEWMSTHPSDSNRRANLKNWLPQADIEYRKSEVKYGLGRNI
jgi:predicted Zn-dependent protease